MALLRVPLMNWYVWCSVPRSYIASKTYLRWHRATTDTRNPCQSRGAHGQSCLAGAWHGVGVKTEAYLATVNTATCTVAGCAIVVLVTDVAAIWCLGVPILAFPLSFATLVGSFSLSFASFASVSSCQSPGRPRALTGQ